MLLQNNCLQCAVNYTLYNHEYIEKICFSEFCKKCSLNLKNNCEICYQCKNLSFITGLTLKFYEKINNCKSCFYKLYSKLEY